MRSTQTCPKCAGKKFAINRQVKLPNAVHPVPAITAGNSDRQTLGGFESWICLGCGYSELYAWGLEGIEALAKRFPDEVLILDAGHGQQGPYR